MVPENKVVFSNNDILNCLIKEIITLKLPPGKVISETETAKRFNVSRTPIREVFKRLEYENLIKTTPYKGTVITPINLDKLNDFMFVREKLEIGVLEELIDTITDEFVVALKVEIIRQRNLIENSNIDLNTRCTEFFALDNNFHRTIFRLNSKSNLWDDLIGGMADYQRFRCLCAETYTKEDLDKFYKQHCEIFELIQSKNLSELRDIYKLHIHKGAESISKLLSEKENYFVV